MPTPQSHRVAVLAFDGVVTGDLSIPCELFGSVELGDGRLPYQVQVCASAPVVKTHLFDLHTRWSLDVVRHAHTVIVPGLANPADDVPVEIVEVLRQAQATGARIASICTGAFVLAATGLLDGLRVTTHWKAANLLASLHPAIHVDPNVLFIDNGQLLTSAGAMAGMDLCLHMVKRDHGATVAGSAARLAVVPLERSGGQAQFIVRKTPDSHTSLSQVLQWIDTQLVKTITVDDIAEFAAVSTRTLNRRFQEQLGVSPLQWVIQSRVNRAQCLLESTDITIEHVAAEVGFGSPVSLRKHFMQIVGTSPTAYRRAFRKAAD
ncbi:GlxA family transcriptional regulator [Pseudomonas sp. YJ42]|uniref:GlxA family transcriptional regulator n=1 Tax=Pseudomonas sp. YJ42 TaxID=3392115 RepID=UPI0039A26C03